jgi:RNA polymerase sigma-70 factor (ECF subfamily)
MSENLLPILTSPVPEAILAAFLPRLRSFLSRRISNQADVDDLAQEILLRVHQGARHLSDETCINSWVWQIARNALIDYYRARNIQTRQTEISEDLPDERGGESLDAVVESWLEPTIQTLPEPYREALLLSEIRGLPQAEVADRLSISLSGAKSRVQRGRVKLREALLACCRFEFDRQGRIVAYQKIGPDCASGEC